ncbi:helix-turn-helix transcriptional regulator [Sulfurimonas sp.]|uniref:helix-turn-helix transcriptional regulator n=1 Tax=Sulfurimonas sp. TaxID=2022749 RepID=UPI003D10F4E1
MKIIIPDFLQQNNLLKSVDTLSFAKYVNYTPLTKTSIQINSNVLIYVTKGSKILHFPNYEKTIQAGDILFLKSGHYIMSEVLDESYEALMFFYSDTLLNEFIKKYDLAFEQIKKSSEEIFIVSSNSYLQSRLLSVMPYFEQNLKDEKIIVLKLEEMFLNLLNSDKEFKNFLQYLQDSESGFKTNVEQNYEKFDSIQELAKHFKMSELNFRTKFKKVFGTTPKKWILSQKLAKAKTLLEHTDLNASEVCREVGFENISWFIQSFKKEFGCTPKQQKLIKI